MAASGKSIDGSVATSGPKFRGSGKAPKASSSKRAKSRKQVQALSIWEKLALWAGRCEGLPPDLARNHDHYLHGRPRK